MTSNDCHCPHCSVSISAWRSRGLWETFSVFSPLCSGAAWTIRMVSVSIIVRIVSVYLGEERSPRWICSRELVCCRSDAGRRLPPGLFELWRCTGCRDCGPQEPCWTSLGLRVIAGHGFLPLLAVVSACCKQDQRIGEAGSNQEC